MSFSIGALARRTSVKIPTIRYYEQIGLLENPRRTGGGQRRYDETDVRRLLCIRQARALGFEVVSIREMLELDGNPSSSDATRRLLVAVDAKIEALSVLKRDLSKLHSGEIFSSESIIKNLSHVAEMNIEHSYEHDASS